MTTARFDIEIQDRVAKTIRTEILGIGAAAKSSHASIKAMKAELSGMSSGGMSQATTATKDAAQASSTKASASDKAAAAMAREAAAADKLAASYRAQAQAARAQSGVNNLLGVGRSSGKSAEDSASVFANAAPTAAMEAAEKAADKYEKTLGRVGNTSRLSTQHAMNLGFQLNDVAVSLLSGQKPLTVFVQQGAQIGQIASQAGMGLGGMAKAAFGLIVPFLPLVAVVGAAAGAFYLFNKSIKDSDEAKGLKDGLGLTAKEMKKLEDTTVTAGDTIKAVFQVTGAAIWSGIGDPVKEVGGTVKDVFEQIGADTKKEVNFLVGAFVGGFRAIVVTWRMLPAAIGDVFVLTVNGAISAINVLVSAATDAVNTFIAANNAIPFSIKLPKIESADIALMKNEYAGAAAQVGNAWRTEMDAAMGVDYVGGAFNAVRDQAVKNARERLEKQAKDIIENRGVGRSGRGGKSEEEKRAEAMDKLNRELDQQILLLGFYGVALDRENKFQTIKNGLLDKGITLSDQEATSIRNRILLIQDGTRVQEALNKIESAALGPQRDYDANVSAITIALKDNIISEEEATRQRTLAKNALVEGLDPLKAYNDNIRQSTEFSALYGKELAIQTRAQELFNQAVAAGKALSTDGRGDFVDTARAEAKRAEQVSIFQAIDPNERTIDTNSYILDNHKALYESIDELRQQDLISEEVAAERKKNLDKAVSDARLATTSGMLGQLAGLQSSSSKKLAALGKAAAIAQATIDGYRAVQAALIGPPGPPWSFAIAGVTAAMTAANVAKIAGVGFMSGGYTGNMPTNAVAGAVHGQEYVFDAAATKRIGVPALEAMRNGSQLGGAANDNRGFGGNVIIKPEPGVWVEERRTSEGEIEIIARRVARQEAPRAVAQDLAKGPNSVASKAVSQSFGIARTKS